MQENVILCVSGITLKLKYSYSMISLWKIAKNKKLSVLQQTKKFNFKSHIIELCKKVSQKIAALSRLTSYLHNSEKKVIFNSIIKSQFSYCVLVWMFCSTASINKLHECHLELYLFIYYLFIYLFIFSLFNVDKIS